MGSMRHAFAFAAVCLLSASAGVAAPSRPGSGPIPQSIWQIDRQGAGRHLQSGLECPARAAGYRIQKIMPFDAFGLDVGCNYWNQNGDAVTVYITKRDGQDLQADFDKANRELVM